MDAYLYDIPADPRGSDGWRAELTARNEEFVSACEANSGGILPYVTTDNAARDMDLLRAVLGDAKLNYLGYSYGTFLGATYAKLFPERVGRLVLDGAIDPSVSGLDVGTTQAVGFESALRAYMADCLTTNGCPFTGSVMTAIIAALYSQDSWNYLTTALSNALSGDADMAFMLADFYNGRIGVGSYQDNSTEAFRAYNCMDYPLDTTQADKDAADALIQQKAPTIAPYWDGVDVCESWPYPPTVRRRSSSSARRTTLRPRTRGRSRSQSSSPPASSSPARVRVTRATTRATRASTTPSRRTSSTEPCRRTASPARPDQRLRIRRASVFPTSCTICTMTTITRTAAQVTHGLNCLNP